MHCETTVSHGIGEKYFWYLNLSISCGMMIYSIGIVGYTRQFSVHYMVCRLQHCRVVRAASQEGACFLRIVWK